MSFQEDELVNWAEYEAAREQLGSAFARILQYFREDGTKSVEAIERAMREKVSVALIVPAHTLKGESLQFGAYPLSRLAEIIEMRARHLVEIQANPDELMPDAAKLRPLFEATLDALERATNPLVERRRDRGEPDVANQKFGRL